MSTYYELKCRDDWILLPGGKRSLGEFDNKHEQHLVTTLLSIKENR